MSIISSNSVDLRSKYIPTLMSENLVCGQEVRAVELNKDSSFVSDLLNAANENGLKIVSLDCATIVTLSDAIGWLRALTEQSSEDKPSILVIKDVTELQSHELQCTLLHSWKNDTNQYADDRPGQKGEVFVVKNREYLIYLTWEADKHDELMKIWHPGDGFAWIGNYEDWKRAWQETYNKLTLKKLKERYDKITF